MTDPIAEDLKKSGLSPQDLGARQVSDIELATTGVSRSSGDGVPGYVIPYYDINGVPIRFYRIRLFGGEAKYRQPRKTLNHIYFPPGLRALLDSATPTPYIMIVEGEKKAATAVKWGFPAVAVSGVYSWTNRKIVLPKDAELEKDASGNITVNFPSGMQQTALAPIDSSLAVGLPELIVYAINNALDIIVCFDTDGPGVKVDVQTAAARLGYELKFRGVPLHRIRQLVLPGTSDPGVKVGLDDYIMQTGDARNLAALIRNCRSRRCAFPRHPNPKDYLNRKMQNPQMSRKDIQNVAMAALLELEARGIRVKTLGGQEFMYFDEVSRTLYSVALANPRTPLHDTAFGAFMYAEYNLAASDKKVTEWLAAQFAGEPGIQEAKTYKVFARVGSSSPTSSPTSAPGQIDQDTLVYQISDSEYVTVSADPEHPIKVHKNGTQGILFEQGQVEPLEGIPLETEFMKQLYMPLESHWHRVLGQMNFKDSYYLGNTEKVFTADQQRMIAGLVFYLSPWLLRWRGTQLPVELVIGEAGSGKSTLYGLRQQVITGRTRLTNMTSDIRDWYAGVTSVGGLYVLDNVHFTATSKDHRQKLSDEICRIVTEPDPHVEMRKLYTTNTVVSLPVHCGMAITSIEQPFHNTDLIQRSILFEMQGLAGAHDSMWAERMLGSLGGRLGWVAHHLVFVHKFLAKVKGRGGWNSGYVAGHRLVNYEQCLSVAATLLGLDPQGVVGALNARTNMSVAAADWTMNALCDFVESQEARLGKKAYVTQWTSGQIAEWAEHHDEHCTNIVLASPWKLGRYLVSNRGSIDKTARLIQFDRKVNNKMMYGIRRKRDDE